MSWLRIIITVPLWWLTQVGFLKAAKHHKNGQGISWLVIIIVIPLWWSTWEGFLQMEQAATRNGSGCPDWDRRSGPVIWSSRLEDLGCNLGRC